MSSEYELTDKATFILALTKIKNVGAGKIAKFVKENNYDYEKCTFTAKSYFKISDNEYESNLKNAKSEIADNRTSNIGVICLLDDNYPKKLCECKKPVILLYYRGNVSLLFSKTITIIGTRKPTQTFIDQGTLLVKKLSKHGYTIVSGLAIGCDSVAHSTALDSGAPTIAVLPSSCDNIYPSNNVKLANRIVENNGLLISEYSVNSVFSKYNLVDRDRIQSILSDRLVVIQATDDGGSMIAVRRSLEDNKQVFALIGNELKLIDRYVDPSNDEDIALIDEEQKGVMKQTTLL